MAETIKKYLNDSFAARWAALILIALAMFFAYMVQRLNEVSGVAVP